VLVGATTGDDAAVFRIADDRALVATVDFFTPIVDDPEDFGAIAAANSLSDVYAMGAQPLFALSLVGFPRDKLEDGVLERIVAGGASALAEAGVPVLGGHSIDDAEPKFGYSVTGEVHPDRMVTNRGAAPGHLLYLTKPLCSGLVATAIKRGLCPPDLERRAVAVMRLMNRQASEAMVEAGVSAATDVTGYGLLGHLANLVPAELGLGAEVRLSAVPVLAGVRELAAADLFPSGSRRNLQALEGRVEWDGLTEPERLLLCDAQTSGGLLVAIHPDRASRFEALLAGAPYPAAQIGVVMDGPIRVSP
jgi:selenide,water dikinase